MISLKTILNELEFKSPEDLAAYKKKHKMRPGTVVKVAGKDKVVGDDKPKAPKTPTFVNDDGDVVANDFDSAIDLAANLGMSDEELDYIEKEKDMESLGDYLDGHGYSIKESVYNIKELSKISTRYTNRLDEEHKMKGARGRMVVVPDNYVGRYGRVQYNLMKKLGYTGGDHNIIKSMDWGYKNYHKQKPNDQFSSSIILKSYPKGDFGDKNGRIRKKDVMKVTTELMKQLRANKLKLDNKAVYRPDVNNPMIEFRVDPKSVEK